MARVTVTWSMDPEEYLKVTMRRARANIEQILTELLTAYEPQVEAWMKQNAPWTDRTGNARQALQAMRYRAQNEFGLQLKHGVTYGDYLELSNYGTYAIIAPAIDHFYPKLVADLRQILR